MECWSEKFEEKLIELWKKHACLYDILTKAFSDRIKNSGARKHFSGNERRWSVYHTSQCSTGNKNTTDLLRADWLYAVQLGQLHCRSSATVELRR